MLADLDPIMKSLGVRAVVVPMHERMHASFRWLSRGAKVTRGYAIKAIDRDPVLVCHPMERDEASASGLAVRPVSDFGFEEISIQEASPVELYARFYRRVLQDLMIDGPIGFVGDVPLELYHQVLARLASEGVDVAVLHGRNPVELARKRKDQREIDAIASVGARTELVVEEVRQVLRECGTEGEKVVHRGRSLKIGDLKAIVRQAIVRHGMIEDHETILSQGRDAGVPHSRGDANAVLLASSPIVLDIFPCDAQDGYFFDTSRTFCVGPVPEDLQRVHALVLEAFERAADAVQSGEPAAKYQHLVCDFFEQRGIATIRSQPATLEGYVHGLGHGVGLDVHERPSFSTAPSNHDLIEDGDIITIEPGLYYPSHGIGVRIEDTFVVQDGRARTLCRGARSLEP